MIAENNAAPGAPFTAETGKTKTFLSMAGDTPEGCWYSGAEVQEPSLRMERQRRLLFQLLLSAVLEVLAGAIR